MARGPRLRQLRHQWRTQSPPLLREFITRDSELMEVTEEKNVISTSIAKFQRDLEKNRRNRRMLGRRIRRMERELLRNDTICISAKKEWNYAGALLINNSYKGTVTFAPGIGEELRKFIIADCIQSDLNVDKSESGES